MDKQNVEAQLTALGLDMLYKKFLEIRRTVNLAQAKHMLENENHKAATLKELAEELGLSEELVKLALADMKDEAEKLLVRK
jgi:DNA-directed RNA polymerase specialized sigma subunit